MLTSPLTHTFFMMVKTTIAWLALSPKQRFGFMGAKIEPILKRHPAVRMRFFDSEAFSSRITDVIMWETAELAQYQAVIEELREIEFWGVYFDVVEIVPAIENAYAAHYDVPPLGA
jgi:Darcynin, domain of unknown function